MVIWVLTFVIVSALLSCFVHNVFVFLPGAVCACEK